MLNFKPAKTPLANLPTPFRLLSRLSAQIGGPRIWIKHDDCTGSANTGNKLRKLEYVIADAIQQGCDTLITCGGVQSNHCRATALAGAQLGLKVHLLLRGEPETAIDGNLFLDKLAGAEVSIYPSREFVPNLNKLFYELSESYKQQGRSPYCVPMGASDEVGIWGYIQAAEELHADFKAHGLCPDAVVTATGSGGTQAGLTLGFKLLDYTVPVYGMAVCDGKKYFNDKVRQDVERWQQRWGSEVGSAPGGVSWADAIAVNTIDDYIGPGYAQSYPELHRTINLLAETEGVILDPVYTGKAFCGLLNEIENGCFAGCNDIVFVHTGGIFGLYPHKDEFFT